MTGLAFKNAVRLFLDSITLFEHKSYPSAYFLSTLSLEELGKVFYLDDFLYYTRTNCDGIVDKEWLETAWWLPSIYSHTRKQNKFARNRVFDLPKVFLDKLETEKQNSVYVGLPREKGKINYKAKIINPLKLGKDKAKRQITIVSDVLLDLTLGTIKGTYCNDSDEVENLIDKSLYSKLRAKWPHNGLGYKKRLSQLEKLEDYDPSI